MSDLNTITQPFEALDGYAVNSTVAIVTSAASQQVTLPLSGVDRAATPIGDFQVDVLNKGATPLDIAICFGTNPTATIPTATAGSYFVAAGERRTFTVPANTTKAAVISTGVTGTVYFSVGRGRA